VSATLPAADSLDDAISRIEKISVAAEPAAVSFGWGPFDFPRQDDLMRRLEQVMGALTRALSTRPGIETTDEDCVVARTAASYSGDLTTVVMGGLADAQITSHLRSLSATLELRVKLVRIVSAAARVIATTSAMAATPLAVVSVPTAIGQLLSELESVVPLLTENNQR
jgi:hypothetical protein